ncbi:MAG: hypothetical protein RBS80_12940 [Thermoguttaceae bacterium]|jgi:hypothetical protein|nr:hypothetical protein [Thermoguttaceae bacterium]
MARRESTVRLIALARDILTQDNPMTLRQVFYQLVARAELANTLTRYKALSRALASARRDGDIPWEWIEDRLRVPRQVPMWDGLADFADDAAASFALNVWDTQPAYVEAWLEKDALSGIFQDVLYTYGATLNVGRGYDSWTAVHDAAQRYQAAEVPVTVLYFGDFDPSGEDMVRSLRERLAEEGARPEVVKCALTPEDIERYSLPPAMAKRSDSRARAFIAKHGDVSVELDALPTSVLRERLTAEVEARMDLYALHCIRETEERERAELVRRLSAA